MFIIHIFSLLDDGVCGSTKFETDATKPDSIEIVTNKVQLWTIVKVGVRSDSEIEVI